jgi:hypothetical protein
MHTARLFLPSLVVALLAACGSNARPAEHTSEKQSCESSQTEASASLAQFVAENRACTQDTDCITVAFGASCFDSCTRSIAADRKDAYESMVTTVNGSSCAAYKQSQCPAFVIPPCAAPPSPRCNAGLCE